MRFLLREGLRWRVLGGALAAAAIIVAPDFAQAQGLFDFLFGGFQRQAVPPPPVSSYAEPPPMAVAPERRDRIVGGGGGRYVAFCVRLCDGQHFPLDHNASATPVETCRAMCPASKTKVYFGSEIGAAVAKDGARYADLDTAFLYRKQLVAKCTCNGKDAFGLAPFDLSSDPTLRPGDIVATKDGLLAYNGKAGKVDAFSPVDPARIAADLKAGAAPRVASSRSDPEPSIDDDPGTITPSQPPPAGQTR